jgi:hypothetical protein
MGTVNEDRLWYAEQARFDGTFSPVVTLGRPVEVRADRTRVKYRNMFPLPEHITNRNLPELGDIPMFFGPKAA